MNKNLSPLRFGIAAVAALASIVSSAATPTKAIPPTTKQVPPKGIEISETDAEFLKKGAEDLREQINALANLATRKPEIESLLPDIEVFWKAVAWPLQYHEFFDKKQAETAKALLKEGLARAAALRTGKSPWTEQTGPVVRGYRSEIDGSAQPYGVLVPATWKPGDTRPRHLYVWNHGRGDTLNELTFISGAMKKVGEFNPEDTFVVAPYGRFCNATKFAGERDVFESMGAVESHYPIDSDHIIMAGFSMGGASVWHLGTHFASQWAAATPGAGFAETAIYTDAFGEGKTPPPWWEQQLWHLYNATDVVANIVNTRMIAYSGEIDPQKQSADLMDAAAAKEGIKLERLIGPNTAHKYEPKTKEELAKRLEESAAKGRDPLPKKVRLVTYTLAYPTQAWVTVEGMEKHWERAEVEAERAAGDVIRAKTKNVSAIRFAGPEVKSVELDGQPLRGAAFRKVEGRWEVAGPNRTAFVKKPGLQGPIDDAFMHHFVFVRPTNRPLNATVGQWAQDEIERAIAQWRTVFRGDVQVVDDYKVKPEEIKNANLILWGDPSSNVVLAQLLEKLPVTWTAEKVAIGGASYSGADHVPIFIYPNPLNPARYVVVNSSFTFRQGSDTTNSLQTPKLPDWAIVDLKTSPSPQWPGLVMDAGFFDEQWQVAK